MAFDLIKNLSFTNNKNIRSQYAVYLHSNTLITNDTTVIYHRSFVCFVLFILQYCVQHIFDLSHKWKSVMMFVVIHFDSAGGLFVTVFDIPKLHTFSQNTVHLICTSNVDASLCCLRILLLVYCADIGIAILETLLICNLKWNTFRFKCNTWIHYLIFRRWALKYCGMLK